MSEEESEARRRFDQAAAAFQAGDYYGAIEGWQSTLDAPDLPEDYRDEMYRNIARAWLHLGSAVQAYYAWAGGRLGDDEFRAEAERIIGPGAGGEGRRHFELAAANFDTGNYELAAQYFEAAANAGDLPDDYRDVMFRNLGRAYLHLQRADDAAGAFRRGGWTEEQIAAETGALETSQHALFDEGKAAFERGDYQTAIEAWERLLISFPDGDQRSTMFRNLGTAYIHLREYAIARQCFEQGGLSDVEYEEEVARIEGGS